MRDYTLFILQVVVLGLAQAVGIMLGFFMVPLMLLFGQWNTSSAVKFTEHPGEWMQEVFPKVFWPWDNVEDSSTGDKRGWWHVNCFFKDSRKWINRFWWLAVRNPFNNFKRYVIGIDVRDYVVLKLAGQMYVRDDIASVGWQWLKAESLKDKMPRYMFYGVWRYGTSKRALVVQIGNKIKMDHNYQVEEKEIDYWKGFTIEVNPFKDIS